MKSRKGITMLILILTIIILLILAGVTISYIMGDDDGAIAQSSDGSFKTEVNQIIEQLHEKETLFELEQTRVKF